MPVSGTVKIGNDAGTPVQAKIVNAAAAPASEAEGLETDWAGQDK